MSVLHHYHNETAPKMAGERQAADLPASSGPPEAISDRDQILHPKKPVEDKPGAGKLNVPPHVLPLTQLSAQTVSQRVWGLWFLIKGVGIITNANSNNKNNSNIVTL